METPVGRILTDLAAADPDRPAVTCGAVTVTRAQLESRANRLARAYRQCGVDQGDFVTIALPNGVEFVAAAFAAWKLGAVPQPVSYRLPAPEREAIVELADAALVVGVEPDAHPGRASVPAGFRPDPRLPDTPIVPDRVAPAWKAPTSGGSTGRPKLIVSGQPGAVEPRLGEDYGMRPDGVVLIPGPLYHNAPFSLAAVALYLGNHVVLLERFHQEAALAAIGAHRVDWVNLVPTMMLRMWRELEAHPGRYDLSSLRQLWHGAAPCPEWLKEAWIDLLGPEAVVELYGGTESVAHVALNGAEWLAHRGSVGRAVFGHITILDEAGNQLPPGEVGEIYMRRPDGAPPSYRYVGAEAKQHGEWISLGDLGWMDEDGYLYLSDRRTDMIVSGGANVYPAEVETALTAHPAVDSCVVVGLPDPDLGQRVHAVVHATAPVTGDELWEFLAGRIVRYKIPRSFHFVREPLRDDAGKVRRSAWRDRERVRLGLART